MESEDKPDNTQREKLIKEEIQKGERDERAGKSIIQHDKLEKNDVKNARNIRKEQLCRDKHNALAAKRGLKRVEVPVYDKPCTLTKRQTPIPRQCMSKQEWIDLLATPSRKCLAASAAKRTETRNLRAIPARINELARPTRNRLITTLQDRGAILPAPLVDRLITVLEHESCLTPEQAERLLRDTRKKKKRKINKIEQREINITKSRQTHKRTTINEETANCQYTIAENFVKSILQWECPVPKEEFQDISDVILQRLQRQFQHKYLTLSDDDRVTPQMRFISDIGAAWIVGVLLEVANSKKDELEKERVEKKKKLQQNMEDSDDDDDDDDDDMTDVVTTSSEDHSTEKDDHDDNDDDPDNDGGKTGGPHGDHDDNNNGEQNEKKIHDADTDDKEVIDDKKNQIQQQPDKNTDDITEAVVKPPEEIQGDVITEKNITANNSPEIEHQIYKQTSTMTETDWHKWTRNVIVPDDATLTSRIYLDIKQNSTLMSGHDVVKSSEVKYPQYSILEREINTPDF